MGDERKRREEVPLFDLLDLEMVLFGAACLEEMEEKDPDDAQEAGLAEGEGTDGVFSP